MSNFKKQHTFEQMKNESTLMRKKYPDRIPVIVEINQSRFRQNLPLLDKNKYLVPHDITVGQFLYIIRKKLNLEPSKAIFLMVNDILPPTSQLMGVIDSEHCEDNGFLFFTIYQENTFGLKTIF